eukprot:6890287-Alexandrium_andersonii.AAC.1
MAYFWQRKRNSAIRAPSPPSGCSGFSQSPEQRGPRPAKAPLPAAPAPLRKARARRQQESCCRLAALEAERREGALEAESSRERAAGHTAEDAAAELRARERESERPPR